MLMYAHVRAKKPAKVLLFFELTKLLFKKMQNYLQNRLFFTTFAQI